MKDMAQEIQQIAEFRGKDTQLLKLAEEASEVIQAAIKYRMKPSDATFTALAEELSDFEIIHEQILHLLPNLRRHEALYRPFKIERELIRMDRDEKEKGQPIHDTHSDELIKIINRQYMENHK